ncbi:hypothetical protein CLV30_10986 [Haloactinopolyspora alba]|uniref:ESAT-6 protein secretion system EspG family protein n=1 Tax=Haloactinopolyspora alba TaxID=648780 RepID=A0A2P8E005_9ACTN|nr:hypothetical protein [Haloactinopolyspora alba]PSL02779.1 hypothetical protein CLV30_10986 [Haloactinopolyspora alba]
MSGAGPSPLGLESQRKQQVQEQLRARFESAERLWLTPEGLKAWLDAAVDPVPLDRVDSALRDETERLRRFELLADDGSVPEHIRPAVDAVREPLCTIDIEAAVGHAPRHFRAWIGPSCAVLFCTDAPWRDVEPTAEALAGHDTSPGRELSLQIVPREQPILAAARWALVTPRRVLAPATLEVPAEPFTRRLVDHTVAVPSGAHERLAEIWSQPLFTWGLTVSPTNDSFMVLDAGASGHRQVVTDGDRVTLHALPSLALWDGIVRTVANALDG